MHSSLPFDTQYISQVTKWFAFKCLVCLLSCWEVSTFLVVMKKEKVRIRTRR